MVFKEKLKMKFVKLIKGEDSQLVTPEYGKKVIEVIDKVFKQFNC